MSRSRTGRQIVALLSLAAVLLGVLSCSEPLWTGAGTRGVTVESEGGAGGAATPPDGAVAARDSVTTGEMVEADSTYLGQSVLFLPFRDASKYKGPWDIYAGLPMAVADSLVSNEFLRVVDVGRILPRLVGDERQGEIDAGRAVSLGRGAGVDWVVLGEIETLTMKRFQATVPVGGYRRYEGWAVVVVTAYRVIDGQRVGEHRVEAVVDNRRTGIVNPATHVPFDRQYVMYDMIEWGTPKFWEMLVGQAVSQCAGSLATGLSEIIRPPPELAVSEPKIIDVDGDRAYINVGLVEGIQNGDKYGVWDLGRELRDPGTGTVLGTALPRRVAVVQVEQVLSDHLSQVRILDGQDQVRKSFTVRAE